MTRARSTPDLRVVALAVGDMATLHDVAARAAAGDPCMAAMEAAVALAASPVDEVPMRALVLVLVCAGTVLARF
tara:strand:+ start:1458 stop:1679 length:222 start_codon:yes stop_codon:yes gene_type:complete